MDFVVTRPIVPLRVWRASCLASNWRVKRIQCGVVPTMTFRSLHSAGVAGRIVNASPVLISYCALQEVPAAAAPPTKAPVQ